VITGSKDTIQRALRLRREMSLPEVLLWQQLRQRPEGLIFRRQQAAVDKVGDFYCHKSRLIIEIDGETHNRGDQPEYDVKRDAWFAERGIIVLRIPAKFILSDMQSALATIVAAATDRVSPLQYPLDGPPPLAGEDFSGSNSWTS
jgi:very-short-patch-repair endonuclease